MIGAAALFLALAGVPLFAVMAFTAIASSWPQEDHFRVLQVVVINFYRLTDLPLLGSLPLFAFSGYLLARSGAPGRLIRLSDSLLGWLPGGLAIVTIWISSLVTALTGASGVTIVALGGLLLPALLRSRYRERFSLGVVTTGGSLGLLFPPSLPVIFYGVVTEVPIEDLYVAGIVPGLLILTVLSLYAAFSGSRQKVERKPFDAREFLAALRGALWEVPLPVFVITGIYTGFITVNEAAVLTATYLLVVEVLVYRDIRPRQLGAIARDSTVLVGGILIILGMSMAVTDYIITEQVPQKLFETIREYMTSKTAFLLSLNVFLLLVGCMIDIYAAIALVVPLIIPVAVEFEIDLVHLGIIFLANLGIGYATPPVGINLFISSVRFKQPVLKLYWACLPFILLLLVALALITYVPGLSLFLVR